MTTGWLRFAIVAVALAAPATADMVTDISTVAEAGAKLATPLRADVDAAIDGVDGKRQEKMTLVARTVDGRHEVVLDVPQSKKRWLVRSDGAAWSAANGKSKKAALDEPVTGTSWTVEDLLPFAPKRCAAMRVADTQGNQTSLVCELAKESSQYPMVVYKFDRTRGVPLQVLYFKETLSNLVKRRSDEDHAEVGGAWRPAKITMQDFKLRTRDEFTLAWKPAPGASADLFDDAKFAAAPLP